jgi:hypothetical protein
LRDELVVAKQRLSDQEKRLATARLHLLAATEVPQGQTTALFEANRAATGDTSSSTSSPRSPSATGSVPIRRAELLPRKSRRCAQ